jgi:ABC-2 type transport system ATP-binding protein
MTTAMIEAEGLTKRYGDTAALDGLDLIMPVGRVTAVLGPNGSGKTTFVRAVATLLRLDGGHLCVAGHDVTREPRHVRRAIGLAGQYAAVEPAMSGRENLQMVARLYGQDGRTARRSTDRLLEQLSLTNAGDRRVRTYSGGMRRRLDLGASLVGQPRLLLLDEPTTGLDPRSRIELWEVIRELVASGTDVLLTTQYLDEADHLADLIVIIDRGRVIATGTPAELKRRVGGSVIDAHVRDRADLPRLAEVLGQLVGGEVQVEATTNRVSVPAGQGADRLIAAVRAIEAAEVAIDDITLRSPTLDEVFLALTGQTVTHSTSISTPGGNPR